MASSFGGSPPPIQRAARVSSPGEPAEREADATANRIMRMGASERPIQAASRASQDVHRKAEDKKQEKVERKAEDEKKEKKEKIQRKADDKDEKKEKIQRKADDKDEKKIDRKAEDKPGASSNVTSEIRTRTSAGAPLSAGARRFMEPRFGADFSGVRVHSDDHAARLNRQVSARAFTYGNHIFFAQGEYQPETSQGRTLLAHELTHTLQTGSATQGAAVQRAFDFSVPGVDTALDYFADLANEIPGFRMLTLVLGVNPITMSAVERSTANVLRAVVEFMPGGTLITDALDLYGVFDRAGTFIDEQLLALGIDGATIERALTDFLATLSPSSLLDLDSVWEDAKRILTGPIDRIIEFVGALAGAVLEQIKAAMLQPLAALAAEIPGWDVLCAVLGSNPITGEAVPRTAETLIGGFMRLIGQEAIWERIQESGAVAKCLEWFEGALEGLLGFVQQIPDRFREALASLEITDIVLLPVAYVKIADAFGSFVLEFVVWGGKTIWNLLEIIFSVVAPNVMPYLAKAGDAFHTILNDPVGFLGNLVAAGQQGLSQFAGNFTEHLKTSLIGWLTGSLAGVDVYIPQALTLAELGKFVLSILGITWPRIRAKIVKALGPSGETIMQTLETGFDIVVALATGGPAAAWDIVQDKLSDLKRMVLSAITGFVTEKVVIAAITKLVSMLNPVGAFIQAILGIYNTVMFFVERLSQLGTVVAAFIDSISAIANGVIKAAADRVEQTMAGSLTLVISFLARLGGIGNVTDSIVELLKGLYAKVDGALDVAIAWIVKQAKGLGRMAVSGARSAAGAVRGWLSTQTPFQTEDGQNHTLYFEQKGGRVQLMRASDLPTEIRAFLDGLDATTKALPEWGQAFSVAGEIELITRTPGAGEKATDPTLEAQIVQKVSRLSRLLTKLVGGSLAQVPPVQWLLEAGASPPSSRVYNLSSATARGGSAASGETNQWKFASVQGGWVRMHLLPHSIGGVGTPNNWIPAPIHVNSGGPVKSFETTLEEAVRSAAISGRSMRERSGRSARPNVVWAEVTADTPYPAKVSDRLGTLTFYRFVRMIGGIYRPDGATWVRVNAPLSMQTVEIPEPEDTRIRLGTASGTQMRNSGLPHLSHPTYGNRLVDYIKDVRGTGFRGSWDVFEKRLAAATANSRLLTSALITAIRATLEARSNNEKDVGL